MFLPSFQHSASPGDRTAQRRLAAAHRPAGDLCSRQTGGKTTACASYGPMSGSESERGSCHGRQHPASARSCATGTTVACPHCRSCCQEDGIRSLCGCGQGWGSETAVRRGPQPPRRRKSVGTWPVELRGGEREERERVGGKEDYAATRACVNILYADRSFAVESCPTADGAQTARVAAVQREWLPASISARERW
jgi:hypothetical protein